MLGTTILSVFEGLMTITLIGFMFEFINPIPVVGRVLKFLGVYSMNIFLLGYAGITTLHTASNILF